MRIGTNATSTVLALLLALPSVALVTDKGFAQKYLPTQDFVKATAVPEPIQLEWKTQEAFPLVATTVIVMPTSASEEEREVAVWLRRGLYNLFGIRPEILMTDLIPEQNAIVMGTLENGPAFADLFPDLSDKQFGGFTEQGYVLSADPGRTILAGMGLEGLKYGAQTILQLITMDSYIRKFVVPPVQIADFPAHDIRGLLIPLRDYKYWMQMLDVRSLIDAAEMLHMNTVILQVDNAIKFSSDPAVARSGAIEKDTLRAIVQYAREAGLEVIPFINTLSHQDLLLCRAYPNLCLNETTYDPSNPKVYDKLFGILDEILEICEPRYVHVGHDWIRALARFSDEKAAELFVSDVRKIYAYLSEKDVQMMMWADMLLDTSHCKDQDNCHGLLANIYTVIDSLPRDIILIDAHYRQWSPEFPSTDYLLSKGFRVVGCVSKESRVANSFSKYAADRNDRFLGMIVALWDCLEYYGMGPSRKILREAAEAFWRGGLAPVDPKGEMRPRNLRRTNY